MTSGCRSRPFFLMRSGSLLCSPLFSAVLLRVQKVLSSLSRFCALLSFFSSFSPSLVPLTFFHFFAVSLSQYFHSTSSSSVNHILTCRKPSRTKRCERLKEARRSELYLEYLGHANVKMFSAFQGLEMCTRYSHAAS
jgi:hypothetical protein